MKSFAHSKILHKLFILHHSGTRQVLCTHVCAHLFLDLVNEQEKKRQDIFKMVKHNVVINTLVKI